MVPLGPSRRNGVTAAERVLNGRDDLGLRREVWIDAMLSPPKVITFAFDCVTNININLIMHSNIRINHNLIININMNINTRQMARSRKSVRRRSSRSEFPRSRR